MKDKTKNSREHLLKAMQQLPSDFALSEVRYYIGQALRKIGIVETKKEKRAVQTQALAWDEMLKTGLFNSNTPGRTVDVINQMIEVEKKKLEDLEKSVKQNDKNDDVQTIFN